MTGDDPKRAVLYGGVMKKIICALVACVGLSGAAVAADDELVGRIAVVNGDLDTAIDEVCRLARERLGS